MKKISIIGLILGLALTACAPAANAAPENWECSVAEDPGTVPGKIFASGDLGSHEITVSRPVMDAEMAALLRDSGMVCTEVHYQKKPDTDIAPDYAGEPEASAVYYLYDKKTEANGFRVGWVNQDIDQELLYGTHLIQPDSGYLLKILVFCQDGAPDKAGQLLIEDYAGNISGVDAIKNVKFSENSLILTKEVLKSF